MRKAHKESQNEKAKKYRDLALTFKMTCDSVRNV